MKGLNSVITNVPSGSKTPWPKFWFCWYSCTWNDPLSHRPEVELFCFTLEASQSILNFFMKIISSLMVCCLTGMFFFCTTVALYTCTFLMLASFSLAGHLRGRNCALFIFMSFKHLTPCHAEQNPFFTIPVLFVSQSSWNNGSTLICGFNKMQLLQQPTHFISLSLPPSLCSSHKAAFESSKRPSLLWLLEACPVGNAFSWSPHSGVITKVTISERNFLATPLRVTPSANIASSL